MLTSVTTAAGWTGTEGDTRSDRLFVFGHRGRPLAIITAIPVATSRTGMEPVAVTSHVLYALFSGLWAGTVLFVVLSVLPLARRGSLDAAPLRSFSSTLVRVSRLSAVVVLLAGIHMAFVRDIGESLTGTEGSLAFATLGLWLVLTGAVEVGARRLRAGTERDKVRTPARRSRRLFSLAGLAAALLLVVAGLVSADSVGLF